MDDNVQFMAVALRLAGKGLGRTSPNPAVGAVIVKDGRVVGRGYHRKAGLAHAEIEAMDSASESVEGATMYVTLEPCCHHGRTPPCADAVIAAGIRKVVLGAPDPNPLVSGKGVERLRAAGIDVVTGVMEDDCRALNEGYNTYISTGLPFVTLKLASSLDGRIATGTGHSRWITGEKARKFVHRLRAVSDAVMVGANTVAADDPELTVRLARGQDPVRVVVDSTFRTPLGAKVFRGLGNGARAVVLTTRAAEKDKVDRARLAGVDVVYVRKAAMGVDVTHALEELAARETTSVLVEGGGTLAASLLRAGRVDKVMQFIAPAYIGGDGLASVGPLGVRNAERALRLRDVHTRRVGEDLLVEGYL